MLYALDGNGHKIKASPKTKAICPFCEFPVISKCGEIKIWHWAHEKKEDCDTWGYGETEWHLQWKDFFPPECVEVKMGKHRADVLMKNGVVIEFQHSSISTKEIKEREEYYGEMVWVFDGEPFYKRFLAYRGGYSWDYPRRSILSCCSPVFIDFTEFKPRTFSTIHDNLSEGFLYNIGEKMPVNRDKFFDDYIHPNWEDHENETTE